MGEENLTSQAKGKLYIIATPIGNLEDLTFRALKTLESVSIIACEDTRQTRKLLNRYKLKKKLISYFHPREKQKVPLIISLLEQGNDVGLVSDAGTPGISDPGFPLIKQAIRQNIEVVPIPGASALTAALSASGLPTHKFLFLGFPPVKKEALKKYLQSLSSEEATLIFYLPARKLLSFLDFVKSILGDRPLVIAREMTKIYEEFLRGKPDEILDTVQTKPLKGEITLLVQGKTRRKGNA